MTCKVASTLPEELFRTNTGSLHFVWLSALFFLSLFNSTSLLVDSSADPPASTLLSSEPHSNRASFSLEESRTSFRCRQQNFVGLVI